jgi:hypothetical protein
LNIKTMDSYSIVRPQEKKFETYRYYLQSLMDSLYSQYNDCFTFGRKLIEITRRLQRLNGYDQRHINRFLQIAWNTEYMANIPYTKNINFLRVANQWKPIQIYFSIYAIAEALSHLIDRGKSTGHKKCLKKISSYFVSQAPEPWCYAFTGCCGRKRNEHTPHNFPHSLIIPHNLQRNNVNPVGMLARCLKAEHLHRIDENYKKEKGKKNQYKYKFDPGYTTILHFFYRLRIKSNYLEADIFWTKTSDTIVQAFNENLTNVCYWIFLMFEIFIIRRMGKECFNSIAAAYMSANKYAKGLRQRIRFYQKNVLLS